ncbi:MAG: hypothetical protein SVR81_10230 [Chloroflexota bacterium]|nr:hypothetical protein [Chloroflexota bacterium]
MTRIIKTTTPGKERARLSKAIVITIREFMRLKEPNTAAKEMVAFVILALREIAEGIEKSVAAWEKRGYWVKADKYRMEWRWSGRLASKLASAFEGEKWPEIAGLLLDIMGQFDDIKVSDRHRMGKPWVGALKEYDGFPKSS